MSSAAGNRARTDRFWSGKNKEKREMIMRKSKKALAMTVMLTAEAAAEAEVESEEAEEVPADPAQFPEAGEVVKSGTHFPNILYASYPSAIGHFKLDECDKVTTVILAEGITEFENDTFQGCKSLTSLKVPSTVSRLGMRAFAGTGLKSIELPEPIRFIREPLISARILLPLPFRRMSRTSESMHFWNAV